MEINEELNRIIDDMEKRKMRPEYIVMGRSRCIRWMVESVTGDDFRLIKGNRPWKLRYRDIPVVVCESDILEVVPNPKVLLREDYR